MAAIRSSCPDCGDVELVTEDVTVRVCADDNKGSYSFQCPRCHKAVVRPAEPQIVELLVASGVRLATWRLPAELSEPRSGAPVSHDELLDFHDLVADDTAWEEAIKKLVEE